MNKMKYLVNMLIAYILYPFKKNSFKKKKIWIVGGNAGELYVDNGRAMYEYLRAKEGIEEYWVINKNSKSAQKIPGKKLIKGSIKSYLYFMNSEVVLFSHSISADIVPYLFVVPLLKRFHKKVFKVFLNHGTVGFKVNHPMNKKTQKIAQDIVKSYDLNICDSNFEKNIKTKVWWQIPENTAVITGYPRYDKLYNVKSSQKEILFMPTWRNWIKSENLKIEDTDYFKNITNLITNPKLNEFLRKNNIKFNIYIHQLMQDYLKNFDNIELSENVKILPADAEITQELEKSEILITDYSSVAYDFYYLNKPIIFFQFDKDEYDKKVGSYVKNKDLFGIQVKSVEKCVENIIKISENNFNYDKNLIEKFEKLQPKFLKYTDKKNCDRVYTEIIKHLKNK
jgi:CDP-glycerol:poly(glycerophosphate)glycerophosph otransferase